MSTITFTRDTCSWKFCSDFHKHLEFKQMDIYEGWAGLSEKLLNKIRSEIYGLIPRRLPKTPNLGAFTLHFYYRHIVDDLFIRQGLDKCGYFGKDIEEVVNRVKKFGLVTIFKNSVQSVTQIKVFVSQKLAETVIDERTEEQKEFDINLTKKKEEIKETKKVASGAEEENLRNVIFKFDEEEGKKIKVSVWRGKKGLFKDEVKVKDLENLKAGVKANFKVYKDFYKPQTNELVIQLAF